MDSRFGCFASVWIRGDGSVGTGPWIYSCSADDGDGRDDEGTKNRVCIHQIMLQTRYALDRLGKGRTLFIWVGPALCLLGPVHFELA
jgi:hypothetical protein